MPTPEDLLADFPLQARPFLFGPHALAEPLIEALELLLWNREIFR